MGNSMKNSDPAELSKAAIKGKAKMVRKYLERDDCDVNAEYEGYTALMWAVERVGHESDDYGQIIELLLRHPRIDVNKCVRYRRTALHVACGYKTSQDVSESSIPVVTSSVGAKMLLSDERCDVNRQDSFGRSPLAIAKNICLGYPNTATWFSILKLIFFHPKCDEGNDLIYVTKKAYTDFVKECLKNDDCDVNAVDDDAYSALMWAVKKVDSNGASGNYIQIIEYLLKHPRIDVNKRTVWQRAALHVACGSGIKEVSLYDVDRHVKSSVGAQMLLTDERCDVNVEDSDMQTPLMHALTNCDDVVKGDKYVAICNLLISDTRCDVNKTDKKHRSALMLAADRKYISDRVLTVAEMLVSNASCDVNSQDKTGKTALMSLVEYVQHLDDNRGKFTELLLKRRDLDILINTETSGNAVDILLQRKEFSCRDFNSADLVNLFLSRALQNCASLVKFQAKLQVIATSPMDVCRALPCLEQRKNVIQLLKAQITSFFIGRTNDSETPLHCAVTLNSFSKASRLLQRNADLNAKWRGMTPLELAIAYQARPEILELLSKYMSREELAAAMNKCCIVGETLKECVARLNVPTWKRKFSCHDEEATDNSTSDKSQTENNKLRCDEVFENTRQGPDSLEIVRFCRHTLLKSEREIQQIQQALIALLQTVSDILAERVEALRFTPVLAGSMAEGTKVYQPNEFDFLCLLNPDVVKCTSRGLGLKLEKSEDQGHIQLADIDINVVDDAQHIPLLFYHGIEYAMNEIISREHKFENLNFFKASVIFGDKISRLQLMWNGPEIRNLKLSVDLALCVAVTQYDHESLLPIPIQHYCAIFKVNRHLNDTFLYRHQCLTLSGSQVEKSYIDSLPINVKRGLILAKAVRIASIAKPDEDLSTAFCLAEDIYIDDLISSHMLKSCLVESAHNKQGRIPGNTSLGQQRTPWEWAVSIYRELLKQLENKIVQSWMEVTLLNCSLCQMDHSCCMKRKLMLAMTRKILQWLQDNEAQLQDIEYADGVDHCDVKTLVYHRSDTASSVIIS